MYNTLFFVTSSILKSHWAIVKRIMGTHHTALSEVSHPFTSTCFSKPRMRAKFSSGVSLKGELTELFQIMKNVLHTIILHRYGASIKVGSESLHNTPSLML